MASKALVSKNITKHKASVVAYKTNDTYGDVGPRQSYGARVSSSNDRESKNRKTSVLSILQDDGSILYSKNDSDLSMRKSQGNELNHETKQVSKRCDHKVHGLVCDIVDNDYFNNAVLGIIIVNIIIMLIETLRIETLSIHKLFPNPCEKESFLKLLDNFFLAVYTIEMLLKSYANPYNYFIVTNFDTFDFIILVFTWLDTLAGIYDPDPDACRNALNYTWKNEWTKASGNISLANIFTSGKLFRLLKVFRALRALRALRTIRFYRIFSVLLVAIVDTVRLYLINVIIILILFMLILLTLAMHFFGPNVTDFFVVPEAYTTSPEFTTVGSSLASMMVLFTVDGWYDLFLEYDSSIIGKTVKPVIELYLMICILVLHFILNNIFVGVNILNIQEANNEYMEEIIAEKESTLARKKELIVRRQFEDVRMLKERQKMHGAASGGNGDFYEMTSEFRATLRHDDFVIGDNAVTDLDWIELELDTFDIMDDQMYRCQQLFFEISHILSMKANEELAKRVGIR